MTRNLDDRLLMPNRRALLAIAAATVIAAGCAGGEDRRLGEPITVRMAPEQFVGLPPGVGPRAQVAVTDIRRTGRMERDALGTSLGLIDLRPPPPELVQAVIQAKTEEVVTKLGVPPPPLVLCGIRVFDITTPSTPLYWDIRTDIEVVLRIGRQDRTVTASATERTFVWPSEELIARVTAQALRNLASESQPALSALLTAP